MPKKTMVPKPREPKRTFGSLFPGASKMSFPEGKAKSWRIGGSGVTGAPTASYWTRRVVKLLKNSGIEVDEKFYASMGGADMWTLEAKFLDGGLRASTGPYFGGSRGAEVSGRRAALFLALSLGLTIPEKFRELHGLNGVSLDELERELAPARARAD